MTDTIIHIVSDLILFGVLGGYHAYKVHKLKNRIKELQESNTHRSSLDRRKEIVDEHFQLIAYIAEQIKKRKQSECLNKEAVLDELKEGYAGEEGKKIIVSFNQPIRVGIKDSDLNTSQSKTEFLNKLKDL